MYAIGNKGDGSIVGIIDKNNVPIDFDEAAEVTSSEESLIALDNEGNTIALISQLSPVNGDVTWTICTDIDRIYRRTVSMSQMTSMLRDNDRNIVYRKAIQKVIRNFVTRSTMKPSVLDIGTGTGLLACIAADEDVETVLGCEMFSPMASIAAKTVDDNGFNDAIQVVNMKSSELETDGKYDIIVSELLDSALLGESVIPTHFDAITRLLTRKEDYPVEDRIVPHSGVIYFACIESSYVNDMHQISSMSTLWKPYRNDDARNCQGGLSPIPIHWNEMKSSRMLSEHEPAMTINFFHEFTWNPDEPFIRSQDISININSSGTIHGIMMTWDLLLVSSNLDPNHELKYSTIPDRQNFQDHWLQIIFPLANNIVVNEGDTLHMAVYHDNIKIWIKSIDIERRIVNDHDVNYKRRKVAHSIDESDIGISQEPEQCCCGWHILYGAERLAALNDEYYKRRWLLCIDRLISTLEFKYIREPDTKSFPVIMDISDGSNIAFSLSKRLLNTSLKEDIKVVSKETKQFSNMFYSQLAAAQDDFDHAFIWDGHDLEDLMCDLRVNEEDNDINLEDPDNQNDFVRILCVISDCFKHQLYSLPIRQAISFYYQVHNIRSQMQVFTDGMLISPVRAKIMIAPIQLTDLGIPHGPIERSVSVIMPYVTVTKMFPSVLGFDHRGYDAFISEDWYQHTYSYKLGNYRKLFLVETPLCLCEINFGYDINDFDCCTKAPITLDGRCDAVAIWVDYILFDKSEVCNDVVEFSNYRPVEGGLESMSNNDFPLYYNVNMRFFKEPIQVLNGLNYLVAKACFHVGDSDIRFEFDIT